MTSVAIVGGGPGGLLSAYLLEKKYPGACEVTLFEATERLGGKIRTRQFDSASVSYESGVAECYDYSGIGPDPLRGLVEELKLSTRPNDGAAVCLDGRWVRDVNDLKRQYGRATYQAIESFRSRARQLLPIDRWYAESWEDDNAHPWAYRSCADVLNEVSDPAARRYLQVVAHSDLATEPHLTSGLNGLKNFLMDVPGYVGQYSIEGGMERLPGAIAGRLESTRVELGTVVETVERTDAGRYGVGRRRGRERSACEFDAVIVALPHNGLGSIEWRGDRLHRAMSEHIAHYDHPGHYLRVSALFETPFWRHEVRGSWFMTDAFGGTCVYDESSRHDADGLGVLGFLLAGSFALSLANLEDEALVARVLESLPDGLARRAREAFIEARVHRWVGAVSGLPGGAPARDRHLAHQPEPIQHRGLFLVGDYLFDGTLNGVYDSADLATDLLRPWKPRRTRDASGEILAAVGASG